MIIYSYILSTEIYVKNKEKKCTITKCMQKMSELVEVITFYLSKKEELAQIFRDKETSYSYGKITE